MYLITILGGFLCDFGETYLMQWTGQNAMFDLRRQLMAKLQTLDLSYFDRNPVGRLVTRVTTDVDVLNELFSSGLVMIIGDLLMLSFVVVAMLQLSPGLTAMLLAVMPLVILVTMHFRRSPCSTATGASASPSPKSTPTCRSTSTASPSCSLFNREATAARVRPHQPRPHGSLQRLHHRLRLVLSGG